MVFNYYLYGSANWRKNFHSLGQSILSRFFVPALFFFCLLISIVFLPAKVAAEDLIPVRLVSLLTFDDHGNTFQFPADVFYDRYQKEPYVVTSHGRIIVFTDDYFPQVSFGVGRGLQGPRSVYVHDNGDLYIPEFYKDTKGELQRKVVILNPALFKKGEIDINNVPGIKENFHPHRVAVDNKNRIYVTSSGYPGVVVFDAEGKFLKWLKPVSRVYGRKVEKEAAAKEEDSEPAEEETMMSAAEKLGIPEDMLPDTSVPAELEGREEEENIGPVLIIDVEIDPAGRIYLLSEETSEVFVYNQDHELLFKFGEKGGSSAKMSRPRGVAVDYDNKAIYLVDYMRHTILVYDYFTGKYIFEFGGRGVGPLWFNFPNSIAVDENGFVIIGDLFNKRVQVIDVNMAARRTALSGKPSELSPVAPPAATAKPPIPAAQEIEANETQITVSYDLTAPVPLLPLAGGMAAMALPAAPVVPELDRQPKKEPEPVKSMPAQIEADKHKKRVVSQPPEPLPPVVKEEPVAGPEKIAVAQQTVEPAIRIPARPAKEKAIPQKDATVSGKKASLAEKLAQLPAAVGVYGPIAAIGIIGGWLLYNR